MVHTGMRSYLVAWDRRRSDWRTFRIVGEPTVGAHFAPRMSPNGGDLKAYLSRSISVAPHADQARVVLHVAYAEMARRSLWVWSRHWKAGSAASWSVELAIPSRIG